MRRCINISMRLIELFPEDEQVAVALSEGPIRDAIKRTALGGAIAAGIGYGYGAMTKPIDGISPVEQSALASLAQRDPDPSELSKDEEDILGDFIRKSMKYDEPEKVEKGSMHSSFPKGLVGLEDKDPDTRVAEFIKHFLPYVEAENKRIMAVRKRLIADLRQLAEPRPISRGEREWIQSLYKTYGTSDTKELLKRIDIIPPSLAMAQAAIESGWGTAELARSHNVFYGQKSWSKTGGAEGEYGERYRSFDSPHMSVGAYMLNLNSNAAYEKFRETRAKLRKGGEPVTGEALAPTLEKYSTLGKDYIKRLLKLMRGRDLVSLDQGRNG